MAVIKTPVRRRLVMVKPDFPALLPPGVHVRTLFDVQQLAVDPFVAGTERHDLFRKLCLWVDEIKKIGITCNMWLDGSFLTQKPTPSDIDCVIWAPQWIHPRYDTIEHRDRFKRLCEDHDQIKAMYGLDLYLPMPATDHDEFNEKAYWRGVFGFCHDRVTAKGFAEIQI